MSFNENRNIVILKRAVRIKKLQKPGACTRHNAWPRKTLIKYSPTVLKARYIHLVTPARGVVSTRPLVP